MTSDTVPPKPGSSSVDVEEPDESSPLLGLALAPIEKVRKNCVSSSRRVFDQSPTDKPSGERGDIVDGVYAERRTNYGVRHLPEVPPRRIH
jgi:hypothetical protein